MTTGWKLDPDCRAQLLERFPPRYPVIVADHVTRRAGQSARQRPPPAIKHARIVGHIDDETGVEALVVAFDGSTRRPDGGVWHITWSLAEGRTAKETNGVLAERSWSPVDGGLLLLKPAVW